MSYAMDVAEKPGYLHIKVTGQNNAENVRGYIAAVHAECSRRDCPFVLIEEDLQGPSLSTMEIFSIVSEGSKNVWPQVRLIAFVDINPEHLPGQMKFAETVAINRGVNIRMFRTLPEAEAWLVEQVQARANQGR